MKPERIEDLSVLRIGPSDILIIRCPDPDEPPDLDALGEALRPLIAEMGRGIQALVVAGDTEIESVSEEEMNAVGWYRKTEDA